MCLGLVFVDPQGGAELAYVFRGRSLLLGRARRAGLCLPDPTVGQRHASLKKRGGVYLLMDEGSPNGTLLQAEGALAPVRLGPEAPRVVLSGDRVYLGNVVLELLLGEPPWPGRDVEVIGDLEEVPRALLRWALAGAGIEPNELAVQAALDELLDSPLEALELETSADEARGLEGRSSQGSADVHGEAWRGSDDGDPHARGSNPHLPSGGGEGLPQNPFPVDLALSAMAVFVMLVAGAALLKLILAGSVVGGWPP